MSPVKKNFLTSFVVVLACTTIVLGKIARERTDNHSKTVAFLSNHAMLASRTMEAEDISEGDFYALMVDLLKREYVDPITDEGKLTTGAIRGMVTSLENPDCLFMEPEQFRVFEDARQGKYEGIGVDLALEIPASGAKASPASPEPLSPDSPIGNRIPALVVASVVPGGPADRAGVKPGYSIDTVDGHWVLNPHTLEAFKNLQKLVMAGKEPKQKLVDMQHDLRKKLLTSIMPLKARDRIVMGVGDRVRIIWATPSGVLDTNIEKATSSIEPVIKQPDGAITLRFLPGAADKLKSALGTGPVTIDLRNNAFGDYTEMRKCLADIAPSGTYGQFVNLRGKSPKPFQIEAGADRLHRAVLLVDASTRGVAEMFALALQSKDYAKVVGPGMSPNRNLVEIVKLPDGSGYTLVTGKFEPGTPEKRRAA